VDVVCRDLIRTGERVVGIVTLMAMVMVMAMSKFMMQTKAVLENS
jgi:hypothetical protein